MIRLRSAFLIHLALPLIPWCGTRADAEAANEPLDPGSQPHHGHPVNRERNFNFYAKQAVSWHREHRDTLPPFPGLDGGGHGHWGNQNEETWRSDAWNRMDIGTRMAGVLRPPEGERVAKAVCVHLEEDGGWSACYDPQKAAWMAVWRGGFVGFSEMRFGLLQGIQPRGATIDHPLLHLRAPAGARYLGFHRHGKRTIFRHAVAGSASPLLRSLKHVDGQLVEESGAVLEPLTRGGPTQWPETPVTRLVPGVPIPGWPWVIDTLELPFANPWGTVFLPGGHDFFANGDIALCTVSGDVWRVRGVTGKDGRLVWKRMASGLHQPLGLVVEEDKVCVLGRDQITRLHDLNGDDEADFYECLRDDFATPVGGHDFVCGLERGADGSWFTVSGSEGLLRLPPGGPAEVVASGFRNPNGMGLGPDGTLTVPLSEGEWTPASAIVQVRKGGYYGFPGPRGDQPSLPPLLWLPRGEDNSSGGQVWVPDDKRWGPMRGRMIHLSHGAGTHFLVLRQQLGELWQGAALPLRGGFRSGVHRGRFSKADGHLYVTGIGGWGSYTPDPGCLQRVRHTGGPAHLPTAFEVRGNGVMVDFSEPVDTRATDPGQVFAQCWNYRHSAAYGSPEVLPRQPDKPGHKVLAVRSVHRLDDGRRLFLEIPDLRPVDQLHLVLHPQPGVLRELFLTVHALGEPFTGIPGYTPAPPTSASVAAAHAACAGIRTEGVTFIPVPWEQGTPGRTLRLLTAAGLQYDALELRAKASERLSLVFENPDVMPHNWVLLKEGSLERVGKLADQLIGQPDALSRHYVPASDDVLCHTRVLDPGKTTTIHFDAPDKPGRYPYCCTFPGHWGVMKGVLIVE
jgi:Copper binding proteins, plastocyanin/azurin family